MAPPRLTPLGLAALLAPALAAAPSTPAAPSLDTLVRRSPFVPTDRPAAAKSANGPALIEFGGYLEVGGRTEVSLLNTATGETLWVPLRDKAAPYFVESFDPAGPAVILRLDGLSVRLPLRTATGESTAPAAGLTPAPAAPVILDPGAAAPADTAKPDAPPPPAEPNRIPRQSLRIPKRVDDPA